MQLAPEKLEFDYDEDEDVLYVSLPGRSGAPAVTCETAEGHLVRLDPDTFDFLGVEVLAFKERWEGRDLTFEWERPYQHFWQRIRSAPRERVSLRDGVLA